jgi:hypothetical protein
MDATCLPWFAATLHVCNRRRFSFFLLDAQVRSQRGAGFVALVNLAVFNVHG